MTRIHSTLTLLLTALAIVAGCTPARECCNGEVTTLRVMSYNIRHGAGLDGEIDLARVAEVIRAADVDLVALQEMDHVATRSGGVDQAAVLGEMLGMEHRFGKFMDFQGGEYGLAVLSRLPIEDSRVIALPPGKHEPRSAMLVEVTPTGARKPVSFVSLHFDWLGDDANRHAQAKRLLASLPHPPARVILAGDFNDVPESRTMQLIFASFADAEKPEDARLTIPANAPRREIDFIVSRGDGLHATSCRVIAEEVASDHRPVVAEFVVEE
jgi:endonuclease/exonuclease/phosphatase family metal-dependent hydrolase